MLPNLLMEEVTLLQDLACGPFLRMVLSYSVAVMNQLLLLEPPRVTGGRLKTPTRSSRKPSTFPVLAPHIPRWPGLRPLLNLRITAVAPLEVKASLV